MIIPINSINMIFAHSLKVGIGFTGVLGGVGGATPPVVTSGI
jgi:hypothetical protein